MKKPMLALIVVIVVAAGIGAYFLLGSSYKQKTPEVKLPSEQTTAPQEKNTVIIKDFVFNPDTLTVKVGDTVTWTNNDGVVHKIKSDTFNSDNLKNGDSFKFQFTKAGTYNYSCAIHPYMTGKIVVE